MKKELIELNRLLLMLGVGAGVSFMMKNLLHAPLWLAIVVCGIIGAGWAVVTHEQN